MNKVTSVGYNVFQGEGARSAHIAWYPDLATKRHILNYLFKNKLTGKDSGFHQSVGIHDMHCTLLYNGHLHLPFDFPRARDINETMPLKQWHVRPLSHRNLVTSNAPIAILLKGCDRLKERSDKLHKKFGLTPNGPGFIFHITITRVQLPTRANYEKFAFKEIGDYFKLPNINFPIRFDKELVSYKE